MILDSDVVIDLHRNHLPAVAWFLTTSAPLYVSGIAAMEFFAGCRDKSAWRIAERFFIHFDILWLSETGLNTALRTVLPHRLANGIGITDALIAATALEHKLPLATFNVKHFKNIPDLRTIQPYTR